MLKIDNPILEEWVLRKLLRDHGYGFYYREGYLYLTAEEWGDGCWEYREWMRVPVSGSSLDITRYAYEMTRDCCNLWVSQKEIDFTIKEANLIIESAKEKASRNNK